MKFVKAAVIGAILIAGAAFAEGDRTDPNAKARSDLMRIVGKNTGVLGDMAGGKAAFDAAGAEAAKAALAAAAADIAAKFEPQATDPATEAKPEIWSNWQDFAALAEEMRVYADALSKAAPNGLEPASALPADMAGMDHTGMAMPPAEETNLGFSVAELMGYG